MYHLFSSLGMAVVFTLVALFTVAIIVVPAAFMPEALGIIWLFGSTIFVTLFFCFYSE